MRKQFSRFPFFLLIASGILFSCRDNPNQSVSFNRDIRPIINNKCITCHGGIKKAGGFSLLFEEEAFGETDSGRPAIIAGNAEASELFRRIIHEDPEMRMPSESAPLTEEETDLIRRWIDEGAKWEKHWAFIPPDKTINPPPIDTTGWARNEIDHFIYNKLKEIKLSPSPEAGREILLRRMSLDLTGLPPTLEELDTFLADNSPEAYEKQADRLLASPHFGERWAAMWLDLARYSDTKGYEKDLYRNIWKYRDWVINAFNQDMPFDQFTLEQLAGDLLTSPTESNYIATAFHRNTMANDEGGTNNEEFRVAANLERVATTYEVWQGLSMSCVQCHSHPYDPIRHEEFYEVMAFFNNTQDRDIYNEQPKVSTYGENTEKVSNLLDEITLQTSPILGPPVGTLLHEKKEDILYKTGYRKVEAEEFHESSRFIELVGKNQDAIFQVQDSSWIMFEDVDLTDVRVVTARYASLLGGIMEIRLDSALGTVIGQTMLTVTGDSWDTWREIDVPIQNIEGKRDVYYYFKMDKNYGSDLLRVDWYFYRLENPLMDQLGKDFKEKLVSLEAIKPNETPILKELPEGKRRKTRVFHRGNWMVKNQEVSPAIPASFGSLPVENPNRMDFARWLVHRDNPLTARVMVNRLWEQLFGYGIVETLEDFGSKGTAPTHPQLLDWLATRFMDEHQWKIKPLLKEIIMSAAYRQSSHVTPDRVEKDPYNKFLSHGSRTRLPAEMIRDQALAVSGLLNEELLGPSVMPWQPEHIESFGGRFWYPSEGKDKYRRALYTYWKRTSPYPSMTTFDSPTRSFCTSRRVRTNTPLQSLVLLNDPVFFEAAEALAGRMREEYPGDITKALKYGYKLLTMKEIHPEKLEALLKLYQDTRDYYQDNHSLLVSRGETALEKPRKGADESALELVANALLNLDECITRP